MQPVQMGDPQAAHDTRVGRRRWFTQTVSGEPMGAMLPGRPRLATRLAYALSGLGVHPGRRGGSPEECGTTGGS